MTSLAAHLVSPDWSAPAAEPAWLEHVREQAWQQLEVDKLPTARSEDWKYTNIELLARKQFAASSAALPATWVEEQTASLVGTQRLVFVDGVYSEEYSNIDDTSGGLTIGPISEHLQVGHVEAELGKAVAEGMAGFTRLATARFSDGVYIDVADQHTVSGSIDLVYIGSGAAVSHQRNVIRLGAGARLSVNEHFLSSDDCTGLSNHHLAIDLGTGARLDLVRVQRQSAGAFLITATDVQQQAESRYKYFGLDTGGRLVRHDIHNRLSESGARVDLSGVSVIAGRQHVDNHTHIEHIAPDCISRERFKAVAGGRARVVFNGKIMVHTGADGTDSSQSNANLLLSEHAEIDTKPELEIYADDVIAAHGATVGQLDEGAIFYLRSRGLGAHEARQLLIRGFCRELVDTVALEELHDVLDGYLVEALPEPGAA